LHLCRGGQEPQNQKAEERVFHNSDIPAISRLDQAKQIEKQTVYFQGFIAQLLENEVVPLYDAARTFFQGQTILPAAGDRGS